MGRKSANLSFDFGTRSAYSLIILSVLVFVLVGVFAFGTQNPQIFGHSAKELDFSQGVEEDAVFLGNVGIGILNPTSKLDVAGEIKIGNSGLGCTTAREGSLRFNAAEKFFELCDGSSFKRIGFLPPPLNLQLSVSSSFGGPSGNGAARLEVTINNNMTYVVDKSVDQLIDQYTANKEFNISSVPDNFSIHYTATVINDDHQLTFFGINILETNGTIADYATGYSCTPGGMSYQDAERRRTLEGYEPALGAKFDRGWGIGGGSLSVDATFNCEKNT